MLFSIFSLSGFAAANPEITEAATVLFTAAPSSQSIPSVSSTVGVSDVLNHNFTETFSVNVANSTRCPHKVAASAGVFDKIHQNISSGLIQDTGAKCPFRGTRVRGVDGVGRTLNNWYPERLRVEILDKPAPNANPYPSDFNYTAAFLELDYYQLKEDLHHWMSDSQSWWPADYGHYGPQMIRTTWHSAGTYRIADGRGGLGQALQRFLPLSSWDDNGNTDKTRRLLWPIKQKYGDNISWADLIALAGNVALESMGVKTVGFGGGRLDAWESDFETYWGSEKLMLGRDQRWAGSPNETYYDLENPLADSEYGLIYVNPEGPAGNPIPSQSAREVRETFQRMAMNDEETVALIAGGHTFGRSHGAVSKQFVGPPPENTSIEYQGLGWINSYGSGNAEFTTTNGCDGSWTQNPLVWNKEYLHNLLDHEYKLVTSPAGAHQWTTVNYNQNLTTPDPHIRNLSHPLMMFTSDIALKVDPKYNAILKEFHDSPEEVFSKAFSEAWYKLIHRDMGPKTRYLGPEVPTTNHIWQDPIPAINYTLVNSTDVVWLKDTIMNNTKLDPIAFARVAWASASTHRVSDKRGGANGARIALAPMKDWEINRPEELKAVLGELEDVRTRFNQMNATKKISLADIIVLAGGSSIEQAAHKGGIKNLTVPFTPGRNDALQNDTDVESFEWLHPVMDGFRNFESGNFSIPAEFFLVDRAALLGLTAPELTVLIGGMRTLNMNWDQSDLGIFTNRPGTLSNDFFVNLLTMDVKWIPLDDNKSRFDGVDRSTGEHKWYATRSDIIFGQQDQLRAVAEVYGSTTTGNARFVNDFVVAWNKVMMLDRFDVNRNQL